MGRGLRLSVGAKASLGETTHFLATAFNTLRKRTRYLNRIPGILKIKTASNSVYINHFTSKKQSGYFFSL